MKQRRFWYYGYRRWTPRWWGWIVPQRFHGGDEFGRHTLVIHLPLVGFLVWAHWTCFCGFCIDSRLETLRQLREEKECSARSPDS